MDGCFTELDGEKIEAQVDEFFRDSFKMLKFFQQKQAKAEQDTGKTEEETAEEAPEEEQKKEEMSTIVLCSTILEQIKEFKVRYAALMSYEPDGCM